MSTPTLQDILARAEKWPAEWQEDLVALVLEMDAALAGSVYHATEEELAAIDIGIKDADEGRFATDQEIAAIRAQYRFE